jgi:hypothetical protein
MLGSTVAAVIHFAYVEVDRLVQRQPSPPAYAHDVDVGRVRSVAVADDLSGRVVADYVIIFHHRG